MPYARTNGIETYYERRGSGPAMVFVHGPIVPHTVWGPQLDSFSDAFTAIAYDLRGHGRTGPSEVDPYSVPLFAEDLAALVDELALEAPIVAGLSMGSFVALTYAAHHPGRVSGLVLVDPFAPGNLTPGEELLRRRLLPALVRPVRWIGFPRIEKLFLRLAARIPRAQIQRLALDWPRMETDEFAKIITALARADEAPIDLSAIRAPTLVVQGADDVGTVHHQTEHLAEELPDVRMETIPDAGHGSHLVHPELFDPIVRGFAEELAASP